jgi:hypothetical protein
MKTNVRSIMLALFTLTIMFTACKKEPLIPLQTKDDVKFTDPINQNDPSITKGEWYVSMYEDGSQIRPASISYLNGYVFKFLSSNVVIGTKVNKSIVGKWTHITFRDTKFLIIDFGTDPMTLMNNKWQVAKQSSETIGFKGMKNGSPIYMDLRRYVVSSDRPK